MRVCRAYHDVRWAGQDLVAVLAGERLFSFERAEFRACEFGAPHSIVIVVVSRPIVIPAVVPVDVPIAIIVADSACHTVQQRPLAGRVAIPLLLVAFE